MNGDRFTRVTVLVTKIVLVGSSVTLLGAVCWKGVGVNTDRGNGNVGVNKDTNTVVGNMNAELNTNVNVDANTNSSYEIDTSGWLMYTNEEYGFSFRYPGDWALEVIQEGGLGTKPGDVQLSKDICQIHVDKPTPASSDILEALTTKELRGSAIEVLNINGLNVIKQTGPVNTYGNIGNSYRILNDSSEVSLFVMQSGLDVTNCVEDYHDIIKTIMRL